MAEVEASGRVTRVPADPLLKMHAVWDLGFADSMAIICVQRAASELRVVDYIEDNRRALPSYVQELQGKGYNWGNDWLPHDGFAVKHQTGKADADVLRALGRLPMQTPGTEVEQGIASAYQIRSIPTLALFTQGREVDRVSGALPPAQLQAWLARHGL